MYHPSGAVTSLTFGNGTTETTGFDGRYRPTTRVSGPLNVSYGYGPAGNVTSITDARPEFSASFTYDVLDRLRTITGWGANDYTYDALGNRLFEANGNVTSSYNASLRLTQTSGVLGTAAYGYDAVGNVTTEGTSAYAYTPFNQLKTATVNGVQSAFAYDGDQQRVIRTDAQGTTYTIRGPGGPIAEYENGGMVSQVIRESIYLGGKLIATIGRPASASPGISVALTSPTAGSTVATGAPVTFSAQPFVASGGVTRVEFYVNGYPIGSDTTAPYAVVRNDLAAGTYRVIARVVAANGSVASSAVATLTLVNVNVPPTVAITAPATNTVWGTGKPLTITATAADSDGIQWVDFYRGSTYLTSDLTAPYSYTWASPETGQYALTAKAVDGLGLVSTSGAVTVTIRPVATVSVAPDSPTAGTSALVTVDGAAFCTSVQVNFGDGTTDTLNNGAGLPMTVAHAWATPGPKTVMATGLGAACDYQATTAVSVLTPPAVSVTAPAQGAQFPDWGTIPIPALASAAQGTIAQVDFFFFSFNGGNYL